MQTLICIETPEWELTISSQHLEARQSTYFNMLSQRGVRTPLSKLQIQPAIRPENITICDQKSVLIDDSPLSEVTLPAPLFFENAQYQFEWVFLQEGIEQAFITHALKGVVDAFRFTSKRKHSAASLIGTINTGNDIGQFSLPLTYCIKGKEKRLKLTLEVLPTKMQLNNDLPAMYRRIDETFPLWRFSLAENTEQSVDKSQHRGNFPLLWLAQFKALRTSLEVGLKVIANSPHNRLQKKNVSIRADRLKGRLSNRLAERVKEDIANKIYDKRYQQQKQHLSVDTPENRYIKMVVVQCKQQLERMSQKLEADNNKGEKTYARLSEHFLNELKEWQQPLMKMEKHSFLKEVGHFSGQHRESLVLQQKTGYSTVYKVWQELKYYLDIFAKHSTVSMKSVAETYEVWCFLEIRTILLEVLGFQENEHKKTKLKLNDYFELQLKDGLTGAGAFAFERADGLRAKLAHEPVFRRVGKHIRSFGVTQKPDILLEVTFPDGKACIWLFDAKYRIKTQNNRYDVDDIDSNDYVPDDAINQMHRYRDALIRVDEQKESRSKSRPVFGAFALYPGFYDQENDENPYQSMIAEVGIGAFALLPSANGNKNSWLEAFLQHQLGTGVSAYTTESIRDDLYVNESARIPYSGMQQVLHHDLVLISKLGESREQEYIDNFNNGLARWFHIPVTVFDRKFGKHIAQELRYLAVIANNESQLEITMVYRIKNAVQLQRDDITPEQAGIKVSKVGGDEYWLLELGEAIALDQVIQCDSTSGFRLSLKLAKLDEMQAANELTEITPVYERSLR
ncbi:restriction endonuclease-like protein [Vibrio splendidus]|uniref:restriction endonuclease-like protein n=1 Tax=Vibrio splendidus TaxID=29497 RepID=UPI00246978A4|nr:restriction endonuclease-like protein [Vibrio splendidus]MDH5934969.1 restriction endonuclease-like protein [Vibrio splendidus]